MHEAPCPVGSLTVHASFLINYFFSVPFCHLSVEFGGDPLNPRTLSMYVCDSKSSGGEHVAADRFCFSSPKARC